MKIDFESALTLDRSSGRLFWKNPPANHKEKVGQEAGYANVGKGKNKTYWQLRVFGKTYKRSRVVFYMVHGRWPEPFVDHINGNSLDDRPENLRECTPAQNTVNSRPKARKYDLPRGVYLTVQGKFMAKITYNQVTKSLGVYETPEIAERVYLKKRKELFDAFA